MSARSPRPRPPRPAARRRPAIALLLASSLALAACDTAEERAENHYQRGMELLAEGETDRAMVEFRNVFRLDDDHVPALAEFAGLLRAQGDVKGAFGHYLRVVELEPRDLAAQIALAEMSLQVQDFESAQVHVMQAFGIAPEDAAVRALKATVDFRKGEDTPAAVAMAEGVVAEAPANIPARMVVIADRLGREDTAGGTGPDRCRSRARTPTTRGCIWCGSPRWRSAATWPRSAPNCRRWPGCSPKMPACATR